MCGDDQHFHQSDIHQVGRLVVFKVVVSWPTAWRMHNTAAKSKCGMMRLLGPRVTNTSCFLRPFLLFDDTMDVGGWW